MANLTTKIKLYLGTDVDFLKDVIVNDDADGKGAYIFYWSDTLEKPKPTDEQLAAFETDGNTKENNNTIRNTRKKLYGDMGDQLDEIFKDIDAWKTRIQKIKTDNPKS